MKRIKKLTIARFFGGVSNGPIPIFGTSNIAIALMLLVDIPKQKEILDRYYGVGNGETILICS